MCTKSFPMLRRLFDAVVLPTVSYGCEVCAPTCVGALKPEVKHMTDIQLAFFRNLGHLRKSVAPPVIFRELVERPWEHRWWSQVIGFMHRLLDMPPGSLHLDILKDKLADARAQPSCGHWASGVQAKYCALGLPSPSTVDGIGVPDGLEFRARVKDQQQQAWADLHVSPRTAPSRGAKLCTYHRCFAHRAVL